jgi:hypothetical protein
MYETIFFSVDYPEAEPPMPDSKELYIAALLRERATVALHAGRPDDLGNADRLKDIDEELKRAGYAPPEPPKAAPAKSAAPPGRRTRQEAAQRG